MKWRETGRVSRAKRSEEEKWGKGLEEGKKGVMQMIQLELSLPGFIFLRFFEIILQLNLLPAEAPHSLIQIKTAFMRLRRLAKEQKE